MAASLFGIGYLWAGRWAGATVAVLGAAAGGWGFTVVGVSISSRALALTEEMRRLPTSEICSSSAPTTRPS